MSGGERFKMAENGVHNRLWLTIIDYGARGDASGHMVGFREYIIDYIIDYASQ